MNTKKYRIRLTTDEQQELNALVSRGRAAAYKQTHARILLTMSHDGGMKDADITSALGVGERIRKRCVEEGVESALPASKETGRRSLIAMACGEPEGRASWTLKLLADQLPVECEIARDH